MSQGIVEKGNELFLSSLFSSAVVCLLCVCDCVCVCVCACVCACDLVNVCVWMCQCVCV